MKAMICPKPYTAAILPSLRERFSCSKVYAHKATFQAYFCSFVLSFFNFFFILGGHMESLCGKLQLQVKFQLLLTLSPAQLFLQKGREGAWGPSGAFLLYSPRALYPPFALPNNYNRSVPSGYLGSVQLNKCIIKQESGQYSVFTLNLIHQLSCNPGQDG